MLFAIVAAVILIADQWLKYWVTVNITLSTGSQELIPGVVKLVNIHNSGAAFGMLDNVAAARWIFLAVTALFVVVIAVLLVRRVFDSRFAVWCEVLFLTGAIGNCIDRVFLGYVVDMFKLEFVNFAVFNIADAVLVVSCLMFVIYVFFGSRGDDGEDEEDYEPPVRVKPVPRASAAQPEPADDFADIFGFTTETREQPQEAQPIKKAETTPEHDAFWDDFGPALGFPAVKPAEKPPVEAAPEAPKAKPESESFKLEDILAEFRDL